MTSFFFNCRGPLLVEFLERETTINTQCYAGGTLQILRLAVALKRPEMLILLHIARFHYANLVKDTFQNSTTYSRGSRFCLDEEVPLKKPFHQQTIKISLTRKTSFDGQKFQFTFYIHIYKFEI